MSYTPKETITVLKTNTCNGNGAQFDAIFQINGTVKITELGGIVTEATDSTTLTGCSFGLNSGGVGTPLTEAIVGTNLSATTVGSFIIKNAVAATAVSYVESDSHRLVETEGVSFYLVQKNATNTYIYFNFTGDANTDVDIQFFVKYKPISQGSSITAV